MASSICFMKPLM